MAAVTDPYATVADYHASIIKSDTGSDSAILDDLTAVTRMLTNELHQFFTKDAAPVARIFYGDGSQSLKVYGQDNCPGIADATGMTVTFDSGYNGTYQTTFDAGTYELHPLDALQGPEPGPYKTLFLPYWTAAPYRVWLKGAPDQGPGYRVKVTAIYGWPSVPKAIQRACIHLTAILRLETPRARREMMAADMVLATSKPAQDIINRLVATYGEYVFA